MVDQDGRSFFEGRAWVAEVVGDMAFVAANEGKTLVAIDLVTGESKVAYSVRVEGDGFGGVEAMATNGSHLAFVSTVYGQDRARSELVVIDGATGDIIAQKEIVEAAAARWIGPGQAGCLQLRRGRSPPCVRRLDARGDRYRGSHLRVVRGGRGHGIGS